MVYCVDLTTGQIYRGEWQQEQEEAHQLFGHSGLVNWSSLNSCCFCFLLKSQLQTKEKQNLQNIQTINVQQTTMSTELIAIWTNLFPLIP